MTQKELFDILKTATGFANKVAYRAFPVGNAPALPFICFLATSDDSFAADGVRYYASTRYVVELYTENREQTAEDAVELALTTNGIFFDKEITYLDSEKCYMIEYLLEV